MVSDVDYFFIHVLAICVSFIGEMSIQDFNPFLSQFFMLWSCSDSLHEFNPLSDKWFPTIFSDSVGCLFILLIDCVL